MTEKEKLTTISKIINRAEEMGIALGKRITHFMDIENACKQFNIDLKGWLNADDSNFAHDFIGIYNNTNRITKKIENFFVPRFAKNKEENIMNETVKIWIEDFEKSERTIAEEIEDTKGTISNERLWAKGSSSKDEEEMHLQNIEELEEYLEWLEEQF